LVPRELRYRATRPQKPRGLRSMKPLAISLLLSLFLLFEKRAVRMQTEMMEKSSG